MSDLRKGLIKRERQVQALDDALSKEYGTIGAGGSTWSRTRKATPLVHATNMVIGDPTNIGSFADTLAFVRNMGWPAKAGR